MRPEVARLLQQITERLEAAATETVQELSTEAAQMIAAEIPANRPQTRQAVKSRRVGIMRAKVGLFFGRQYTRNKRSFTYRTLATIWRQIVRPRLRSRLVKKLNEKLKR